MKRKINPVQNLRLDVPDASAIHGLVDEEICRSRASYIVDNEAPSMLVDESAWVPRAVVVSGWTVRRNTLDDQQVLVTPGVAICAERLDDGTLRFGQLTVDDTTERVVVMTGSAGTKYLWVKYVVTDGESGNRARWRPDLSPEQEQVFLHTTRLLGDATLQLTTTDDPPDELYGWFKIAELDYTGSVINADSDIVDRRTLLFEGIAGGSANPATTWTIPDFVRTSSRSTVGTRALFDWAMAMNKRLEEIGGRSWFTAPVYGENVRSASSDILVTADSAKAAQVHHVLDADTATRVTNIGSIVLLPTLLSGGTDSRDTIHFIPNGSTRETINLDVSSASCVWTGPNMRRTIKGGANLVRDDGNRTLVITSSGLTADVIGLKLSATNNSTKPLFDAQSANDRIRFVGCIFDSTDATAVNVEALVDVTGAGEVEFDGCTFAGYDSTVTIGVRVAAGAFVTLRNCRFTGCLTGVDVAAEPGRVIVEGCSFDDTIVTAIAGSASVRVFLGGNDFDALCAPVDLPNAAISLVAGENTLFDGGIVSAGYISGYSLESRTGNFFAGNRERTIQFDTDGILTPLVGADVRDTRARKAYLGDNSLRLEAHSTTIAKLLDDSGTDEPVASHMWMDKLLLGPSSSNALAKATRSTLVKAWGTIEYKVAWTASGAQDRTTHSGTGFFASRIAHGGGVDVITVTALDSTGSTNTSTAADKLHRFRVSGLDMGDSNYIVLCGVGTTLSDSALNYSASGFGDLVPDKLTAQVYSQAQTSFIIQPMKLSASNSDPGDPVIATQGRLTAFYSASDVPDAYYLWFVVIGAADIATFVQGEG